MLRIIFVIVLTCFYNVASADDSDLFVISNDDQVYGVESAPLTIFEYSSLTCVHCAHFHLHTFPKIKANFIDNNKVRWVRRNYVSDRTALAGSLVVQCVDRSVREKFLKILFSEQSTWAYTKKYQTILDNILILGGQNTERYKRCAKDKKTEDALMQVTFKARSIVKGTPAFIVDGKRVDDLHTYPSFEKFINNYKPSFVQIPAKKTS